MNKKMDFSQRSLIKYPSPLTETRWESRKGAGKQTELGSVQTLRCPVEQRQEAEGTRTKTHRQLQCYPINILHAHNCTSISEAQAQQSNPSVYRSEASFSQPIRDLGPHFLLPEKYFPLLPFLLPFHHLSCSPPENRFKVVGQVLHSSFISSCTQPPTGHWSA